MRTILLPLVSEATDHWAIEAGLALAVRFDAHLNILLLRPEVSEVPVYAHCVTSAGYGALIRALENDFALRETNIRHMLASVAQAQEIEISLQDRAVGGARATFHTMIGDGDRVIRESAAVNDIIFFPRVSGQPGEPLAACSLLKDALEYSGRPILVATDSIAADFSRTVVIAWNGSTEGARAVTAALPILQRAAEVFILTVRTTKTRGEEGERLREYLSRHDIVSHAQRLEGETSVAEELMSRAAGLGAGLIVTGGYTHSRLRQTLFGGVTHDLLENCTLPLLLAH